MVSLIALLLVFGFLGVFDLIDSKKINIIMLLLGAAAIIIINMFSFLFSYMLIFGIISIIVLLFIKSLGIGDKFVLSVAFLMYPFYLMWIIILFALAMSKVILKIKGWFISKLHKRDSVSVAFYPFLFISTLAIYLLISLF